jgi:DNA repair exonuclease SbcCD nuclease subunit
MKIALITDTHFGARNDSQAFADYFKEFYDGVFFPFLDENNIDTVIHLGDIVDRRKYINFSTARHLEETLIKPLYDRGIDTHMLIGNHDTYYKNTNEINSMRELYNNSRYNNLHFYSDVPEEVDFDGCKILMTPWICTGNYEQSMEIIQNTSAQVLFGHLEIKGFEMYKGAVNNDHGFSRTIFNRFDVVCSGHFHHKSTDGNITYLGAPYQITWSDFNDPRGFHVFDTDDRSLTFYPNPLEMFHKIHYNDVDKTMEQVVNHDFEKYYNKFVKVIVSEKSNPYWFDMFIDKLEKAGPFNVQVVEDHLHLDLESDDDIINEAEDTMTILHKYIDSLDISTDKKHVEETLKDLYQEALSVS